jgi:hypothetical protein
VEYFEEYIEDSLLNGIKGVVQQDLTGVGTSLKTIRADELYGRRTFLVSFNRTVLDHDRGQSTEVNACILITHMVYL